MNVMKHYAAAAAAERSSFYTFEIINQTFRETENKDIKIHIDSFTGIFLRYFEHITIISSNPKNFIFTSLFLRIIFLHILIINLSVF